MDIPLFCTYYIFNIHTKSNQYLQALVTCGMRDLWDEASQLRNSNLLFQVPERKVIQHGHSGCGNPHWLCLHWLQIPG